MKVKANRTDGGSKAIKPLRKKLRESYPASASEPAVKEEDKASVLAVNPFYAEYLHVKKNLPIWNDIFTTMSVEQRTAAWDELDHVWNPIRDKYAWAIPDSRALKILKNFSPLVEVGGGKGYWASLLEKQGVDIASYDIRGKAQAGADAANFWTDVKTGGPTILKRYVNRSLFLCYPDEDESIAIQCMEHYRGEYIIHVGELQVADGTAGGAPQAPYGRTSSGEFQRELSASFHPLLVANLKARLPFSRDTISVWKRTDYVDGRLPLPADEEEEDDGEEGHSMSEGSEGSEGSDDDASDAGSYADFNNSYFADFYEHEKMLADKQRMSFYRSVIEDNVKKGDLVVDVGTGTGVLAAFASRAGASYTYAIDHNDNVACCAEEVAKRNNIDNVEFVIGHSREFSLPIKRGKHPDPDQTMPDLKRHAKLIKKSKVDVIVHEQMGDCLFDEDMVANITDLRDRLLKPGGVIVPSCYDLYVEPVQLDRKRAVPFIQQMTDVEGYDFSCMAEEGMRKQFQVDTNPGYHHLRSCDPNLVDKYLTELKPVLSVDLHTITESTLPLQLKLKKKATASGTFDGYAVFFRCRGSGLTLETDPHSSDRACHWGYRILRCGGLEVQKGATIDMRLDVGRWADLNSWNWDQKLHGDKRAWKEPRAMPVPVEGSDESGGSDGLGHGGSGGNNGDDEEDDHDRQQRAREAELDVQYAEAPDKQWASIPRTERLPCDRAAPCLAHLLE